VEFCISVDNLLQGHVQSVAHNSFLARKLAMALASVHSVGTANDVTAVPNLVVDGPGSEGHLPTRLL
jgi:hypothetical protein